MRAAKMNVFWVENRNSYRLLLLLVVFAYCSGEHFIALTVRIKTIKATSLNPLHLALAH